LPNDFTGTSLADIGSVVAGDDLAGRDGLAGWLVVVCGMTPSEPTFDQPTDFSIAGAPGVLKTFLLGEAGGNPSAPALP
jgi:hypothetical protein